MSDMDLTKELQNTGLDKAELFAYLTAIETTYNTVKSVVTNSARVKVAFDVLCEILGGHNNDDTLFDIEKGDIIMTVQKPNFNASADGYTLSEKFALWVDNDLQDGYTYADILKAYELCK